MRDKYRRKGWIKVHRIDVETKQITAYEVTDEQHDNRVFRNLVEKSCEKAKVKRVLADKAYDSYNFEFLQSNIEPAIPVRKL